MGVRSGAYFSIQSKDDNPKQLGMDAIRQAYEDKILKPGEVYTFKQAAGLIEASKK